MRKSKNLLSYGSLVSLCITLVACGGGSGGEPETGAGGGDVVTFGGGTIDDLRALNGALTFGSLSITGPLQLPIAGDEKLTVGDLTVTTDGSIGYEYSTCEYRDAPSLTIEASGDVEWFSQAIRLERTMSEDFEDRTGGGFYLSSDTGGELLTRAKPGYDGSTPSANSVALMNLLRFYEFTSDDTYRQRAVKALTFFGNVLSRSPAALVCK